MTPSLPSDPGGPAPGDAAPAAGEPGACDLAAPADAPLRDQVALFDAARARGLTGLARKVRPVDARPARPGEVVVSVIRDEGVETASAPARAGDWVVRNRSPETGDEEILVSGPTFAERYGPALTAPDAQGYRAFRPRGVEMGYFLVPPALGAFRFMAPWGTMSWARPGDAIVQSPGDPADTYRVAAAAFAHTFEVLIPASREG